MSEGTSRGRTGRRSGRPDTRGEIIDAAQRAFIEHGYANATIRGIAREAGVDPALIHRWFGDKRGLVLALMKAGFDPVAVIEQVVSHGRDQAGPPGFLLGHRIASTAVGLWESPIGAVWIEAIRRSPGLASVMVGFMNDPLISAGKRLLNLSDAEARHRVAVIESIMVGILTTRHLVRLEPLASMPQADVVRLLAPMLDRAMLGDVGVNPARSRRSLGRPQADQASSASAGN